MKRFILGTWEGRTLVWETCPRPDSFLCLNTCLPAGRAVSGDYGTFRRWGVVGRSFWGQNLRFYKLGPLPVHTHLPDLWQHEQEPHTPAATQPPCLPPTMSCTPNPSKGRHVGPEEKKCDYCTGETWWSGCSYLTLHFKFSLNIREFFQKILKSSLSLNLRGNVLKSTIQTMARLSIKMSFS